MQIIELKIKGKDNVVRCIVVDNGNTYEDSIIKYLNYSNTTTQQIRVTNRCRTTIILPMQDLFLQQDNLGSTFKASIDNTPIPAGQTINVPVYYNGKYKGASSSPIYQFIINGATVSYKLNVINNDIIGTIESFIIEKESGELHTYTLSDFLSHYNDPNIGDTISTVMFFGAVDGLRYNNVAYIEGEEIPVSEIDLGKLTYLAPNTDDEVNITFTYKVRDTNNNIIE